MVRAIYWRGGQKMERTGQKPVRGKQRDLSLSWLLFGGSVGGSVGVLFLEALDAASGVHKFLLAGEKGVATRADFDAQHVALDGRARLEGMPASTMDGNGVVIGVDPGFHEFSNLSWPVCAGTGKCGVTTASLGHETIHNYTAIPRERKTGSTEYGVPS